MRRRHTDETLKLKENINNAIKQIKEYGYQDKYAQFMEGNHYGFIAVVDAISILESCLRIDE